MQRKIRRTLVAFWLTPVGPLFVLLTLALVSGDLHYLRRVEPLWIFWSFALVYAITGLIVIPLHLALVRIDFAVLPVYLVAGAALGYGVAIVYQQIAFYGLTSEWWGALFGAAAALVFAWLAGVRLHYNKSLNSTPLAAPAPSDAADGGAG